MERVGTIIRRTPLPPSVKSHNLPKSAENKWFLVVFDVPFRAGAAQEYWG